MTTFQTCYKTTAGLVNAKHNFDQTLDRTLKEALIASSLSKRNFGIAPIGQVKAVFIAGLDDTDSSVPAFIHPYLIQSKEQQYLISDIRAFKNSTSQYINEREFEAAIRNKAEYYLTKNRTALELEWIAGNKEQLRTRFSFAGTIYSAWISQATGKAYGLDFQDQKTIQAISLYYYHTLFNEEAKLSGRSLEIAIIHTIKITKLSDKEVDEIFAAIPPLKNANDLTIAIRDGVKNVRLKDFNLGMLLTLVKNSWYGNNAKDLISVALEHPPTWITIVGTALSEKTYKASPIYRLIESQNRQGNAQEFQLNYADQLSKQILALESASFDMSSILSKEFD